MTDKQPYTFTVLRYLHDVVTDEFVNVGVLLHESKTGSVHSKLRTSMGRVRAAFPGLDRLAFVSAMKSVQRGLRSYTRDSNVGGLLPIASDARAWGRLIVPADDSALQWSSMGSGVTDDARATLERLFERFVTRNDLHHLEPRSRTDDDVWRPVREELLRRDIQVKLEEKTVGGTADHIVFKHAWKNGVWHAYQPISFDLADADGIKDKARRWRGHLSAASEGASEKIKLHLILGGPKAANLIEAYNAAIAILQHAAFDPKLYAENRIAELVNEIEEEVRGHQV